MSQDSPLQGPPLRRLPRLWRKLRRTGFLGAAILACAPAPANVAPVVDDLAATPASVAPGGTTLLTLEASDPDCPATCIDGCGQYVRADLLFWSADGGSFANEVNGGSGSPFTAEVDWVAPLEEGVYTISVFVADSGGFLCGGRESTTAELTVQVTTSTNDPPAVDSLTAEPNQLFPGESSTLTCVGSDPNDDPLVYSWSADSGTVAQGAEGSAVFTADDPGGVLVTCTVMDPEGATGQRNVTISVIGAIAEKAIGSGLVTPQRIAVDSLGDVFVVDASTGGVSVFHLLSGERVYRLPLQSATAVAVDWLDRLVIGDPSGAGVYDRSGVLLFRLSSDEPLGDVVDVACDPVHRRYGVLHRSAGRAVIFDEDGNKFAAFGSNGDAPDQFKSPQGLAADPLGRWVVADSGHARIKVHDATGALLATYGDSGGGPGEFVQLDDVAVDGAGVIHASDAFQGWVQTLNPDGTPREILGGYGDAVGQLKTAAGIAIAEGFDRLLVASINSATVQVFATNRSPVESGPTPLADIQPAAIAFDPLTVGATSSPRSATVTNLGDAPLGLREVRATGDFLAESSCSFVEPGSSCAIEVRFAPKSVGVSTGVLEIDTSEGSRPRTLGLSGFGFVPGDAVVTPARLDYSDQEVGTISERRAVTLTNAGTASFSLFDISTSGEFFQSNDCGSSVTGGTSCTITVVFAPRTVADFIDGTVEIRSDAPGSPHVVVLEGRGIPGDVLVSIGDHSVEESADDTVVLVFPVTLSNPGAETVTVDYATRDDTALAGEDFVAAGGTLSLAPGETGTTVEIAVLDDTLLEPDAETLLIELSDPVGAELGDALGIGTIVDDERCPGPNLLSNPGAEEAPSGAGLPGWTPVSGVDWQPGAAPPDPFEGDAYFFAGSATAAELAQDVNVAAYGTRISAGIQRFAFEARVRSDAEVVPDSARLVVEYRNADNTVVLDSFDSGALASVGAWLHVTDERVVPADTRWIRVRLISTRHAGADNDGYFDGLSLHAVRTPTVAAEDVARFEGDFGLHQIEFPVMLGCRVQDPIEAAFATANGTALAGEDYLPTAGGFVFDSGEVTWTVPVLILGDEIDEAHESFDLQLSLADPGQAVLADATAEGRIVNDDFCPQAADYWIAMAGSWPVTELTLGARIYDETELLDLLTDAGGHVPARLAQELVATKLNLAVGSDPAILPVVESADAFLVEFPPGTKPRGASKTPGKDLKQELARYNDSCEQRWRRRER